MRSVITLTSKTELPRRLETTGVSRRLDTPRARNLALMLLAMTQFVLVFERAFMVGSGIALVGAILALVLISSRPSAAPVELTDEEEAAFPALAT